MFKKLVLIIALMFASMANTFASYILIPMDTEQKNHLKAYGIAYWTLKNDVEISWLLNYRGGSFMIKNIKTI